MPLDPESPWRSPEPMPVQSSIGVRTRVAMVIAAHGFIVLPLLGGLIGFVGDIIAGLVIEARRELTPGSFLSYGQQAAFFSLPICTIICAVIGLAIACAMRRRYVIAMLLPLAASIAGWIVICSLWNDQITRYGRDPSEVVLYYPPSACAALAMVAAVVIGFLALAKSPDRDRGPHDGA